MDSARGRLDHFGPVLTACQQVGQRVSFLGAAPQCDVASTGIGIDQERASPGLGQGRGQADGDGRRAHAPFAAGERQQRRPAGGIGPLSGAALRCQSSQVVGLVEHQKDNDGTMTD